MKSVHILLISDKVLIYLLVEFVAYSKYSLLYLLVTERQSFEQRIEADCSIYRPETNQPINSICFRQTAGVQRRRTPAGEQVKTVLMGNQK